MIQLQRQIAAVALCLLAPLQAAQGVPPAADTRTVFGDVALPCVAQVIGLQNRQIIRMAPDRIVGGLGRALGGADVVPGMPRYDQTRALVAAALAAEEAAGGPLFTFNAEKLLAQVLAGWDANDRAYYTAFFARPAGRLYLTDMLDGATCAAWLNNVNAPPLQPLDGADKAQWDKLRAGLDGAESRFLVKLHALSQEEQRRFTAGYNKLGTTFDTAPKTFEQENDAALKARIARAIGPRRAEIRAAVGAQ
jgi:hypothetical protein